MRQFPWAAFRVTLILIGILVVLLLFVLPISTALMVQTMHHPPQILGKYLRWIEGMQRVAMQAVTVGLFFFVGSCFASFLNVVAWRLPRGRSIFGNSRCPRCDRALTFRDNFPVVGWLRNQGRCRYCSQPISARYLWVELALGTIFLAIVLLTISGGGIALPVRPPDPAMGFERILFDPHWDLIQITAGHLGLVLWLFLFLLIEFGGDRIPRRLAWLSVVVVAMLPLLMPPIQLIGWDWPWRSAWPPDDWGWQNLLTVGCGGGLGALLGWGLTRIYSPPPPRSCSKTDSAPQDSEPQVTEPPIRPTPSSGRFLPGLILVGLMLGWQSALVVSGLTALFSVGARRSQHRGLWASGHLRVLAALLIHLSTWRWMNYLPEALSS